jgi:nucleoside-diphosphate-sugar epimerase
VTTLLIGGTGFLGSYVAHRLRQSDLVCLTRPSSDVSRLPPGTAIRWGSLDDQSSLRTALLGVDTLVYCASMGFGHVPHLVPMLEAAGVRRAVFVSTTAIFTSLPAPSRTVRLDAEAVVRASGLEWTVLRPTMIYGSERDRNISRLLRFLARSPVFPLFGNGRALHQPVFVEDLADAVVAAIDTQDAVGQAYNLAGAFPLSYADLIRTAGRAINRRPLLLHVPLSLALAGARGLGFLPGRALISPEQVLRLAEDKAFDYSAAVRDLGFSPRSFEAGTREEARSLGLV